MTQKGRYKLGKGFGVRFGTLHPMKGPLARETEEDGVIIYSWDYVDRCMWHLCKAHEYCHFYDDRRDPPKNRTCRVMHWMLEGAAMTFFDSERSAADIWRIGMHILPLYRLYCKLLIEEVVESDVLYREKGVLKINPIQKAISDIIDRISREVGRLERAGKLSKGSFEVGSVPVIDEHFSKPKKIMYRREKRYYEKKDKAKRRL